MQDQEKTTETPVQRARAFCRPFVRQNYFHPSHCALPVSVVSNINAGRDFLFRGRGCVMNRATLIALIETLKHNESTSAVEKLIVVVLTFIDNEGEPLRKEVRTGNLH